MRRRRMLPLVFALLFCCLVIGAAAYGVSYVRGHMNKPKTTEAPAASVSARKDADDTLEILANGVFQLRVFTRQVSGGSYISFAVYRMSDGEELYTCGRMFPADEVASVGWVSGNCDIEVRMKDGKTVTFSYNGITEWI